MKVICISGKAQHGKDTTANLLANLLEDHGYKVRIVHYADLLKYICKTWFDWDGEKDDYGRALLQHVGTDVVRAADPYYWVDFVVSMLKLFPNEWDYVIIPDCRFPNELDTIRANDFDMTHVRVIRPNFESPLSMEQQNHPSEIALDNVEPDIIIYNRTTNKFDLQREIISKLSFIYS